MAEVVVKYGIVGVGMMGREHMLNIAHLQGAATVSCVADPHLPSQQSALNLAAKFGWSLKVFNGHQELLESGLCDAVIVSAPNMTHFHILMDIINHPRLHHILVEKPLCTTVKDCKKVIDSARRRPDIVVQVGLEYRYMPATAKLIDVVKSGKLGRVHMVAIREHRFPFLVKVPDIIDNAFVIIEFENGSRGMLDLCMFAEGSKNEQEISVVGHIGKGEAFMPENIVRVGTRAAGGAGVETMKSEDPRIRYDGLHHGASYLEHLNFLDAIKAQGRHTPAVDLEDGLYSVAMGVAAQLSIEKGHFVTIKEVMD
ncbi:uncharacterized protein LOC18428185 isoform X3 [Amborella trichopoda]|uniref:uncharacterized protein LOC18428185 isoform X3 n=1 Tax=Amborella trichopoda TaxID=13333 RepID=UPI0009BFF272|nr:uncharacterized protein LOC18428185 isoform X3 [Amborella trichopoda]|eukprot:XP_020519349.1 uncharacterized protein LOC18428185 isoform X3 [Amborella trichopoda]